MGVFPIAAPWLWLIAAVAGVALVYYLMRRRRSGAPPLDTERREPLTLANSDFEAFEVLVHDLNEIWRARDVDALDRIATHAMAARLGGKLAAVPEGGGGSVVYELALLRGEVVRAWRDENSDHAQINMRISSLEAARFETEARRFVSSEVWSFDRSADGKWRIAGVKGAE